MAAFLAGLARVGRRVKRAAAERALVQAAKLYGRASDSTLKKAWRLLEGVATDPGTRFEARRMRYLLDIGHPAAEWLRKIARSTNPVCARKFITNLYGNAWFLATDTRNDFKARHGFLPPWLLVFDMTMRCNLRCEGCWAGSYTADESPELEYDVLARVLEEARDEMGIHFFVVTGGEPFARTDSWRLYEEFGDCQFFIYTNATMIGERAVARLAELGNCMLMMSVEGPREATDARRGAGTHEKVMRAMDLCREAGVLFGFSATPTRHNWEGICSDEFVSAMVGKGCTYGWFFQYIPVGRDPDVSLMVPPAARDEMRRRLYRFRERYPIYLVDFWNDGPETGGCIAGGRYYLHLSANGDIEPCVFAHLATMNVRDATLTDALKSPLFTRMREGVPYEGNLLRPCMIIDRPEVLRKIWRETGAYPTHPGADALLGPRVAAQLDEYAAGVREVFDPVWSARADIRRIWPDPPADYR